VLDCSFRRPGRDLTPLRQCFSNATALIEWAVLVSWTQGQFGAYSITGKAFRDEFAMMEELLEAAARSICTD
jgi:hypothetical protein